MKKLQSIQALRGVAVLAVVLFHLLTVEEKYGGSKTILSSFFQFGMFGVDLFFVISGFVMITVTRGKFQYHKEALKFIYHRVVRIYPTYWVYSILVLGVFLIKPSWVNSSQGNQVDILASFLLLPSQTLPLVMVGWTLIHEMYFYLVFSLILMLVPEKKILPAILLWGVTIVCLNLFLTSNTPVVKIILITYKIPPRLTIRTILYLGLFKMMENGHVKESNTVPKGLQFNGVIPRLRHGRTMHESII